MTRIYDLDGIQGLMTLTWNFDADTGQWTITRPRLVILSRASLKTSESQ